MSEAPRQELSAGDYRIAPSEKMRTEYGVPLDDVLSGDFEFVSEAAEEEEFHKYDVDRADDTPALDIFETHGSAEIGWLPFSLPQYVFHLVRPEGDPCLLVEVDHSLTPSYTVRDPRSGEPVGKVAKSSGIFGNWQLQTPSGAVRATAERDRSLRTSGLTKAAYAVSDPRGTEFAQFERVRADDSGADRFRLAMEVSCSRSSVSTEECLAFAFALLHEGTKSSGGGATGGV